MTPVPPLITGSQTYFRVDRKKHRPNSESFGICRSEVNRKLFYARVPIIKTKIKKMVIFFKLVNRKVAKYAYEKLDKILYKA